MAERVITTLWSRLPVPFTRTEIWFVQTLKALSPLRLLIPYAGKGNGTTNCNPILLQGSWCHFFLIDGRVIIKLWS